jgi:hypothetical protein
MSRSTRILCPAAALAGLALVATPLSAAAAGAPSSAYTAKTSKTAISLVSPSGEYPKRTIKSTGKCWRNVARKDGTRAWVLDLALLKIAVPEFSGPRTYTLPGAPKAKKNLPFGKAYMGALVGPWLTDDVSSSKAGTFVVNKGRVSGTVNATFSAGAMAKPLKVTGTWSCKEYNAPSYIFPGLPSRDR